MRTHTPRPPSLSLSISPSLSPLTQAGLKIVTYLRINLNSGFSCLQLLNTGIPRRHVPPCLAYAILGIKPRILFLHARQVSFQLSYTSVLPLIFSLCREVHPHSTSPTFLQPTFQPYSSQVPDLPANCWLQPVSQQIIVYLAVSLHSAVSNSAQRGDRREISLQHCPSGRLQKWLEFCSRPLLAGLPLNVHHAEPSRTRPRFSLPPLTKESTDGRKRWWGKSVNQRRAMAASGPHRQSEGSFSTEVSVPLLRFWAYNLTYSLTCNSSVNLT